MVTEVEEWNMPWTGEKELVVLRFTSLTAVSGKGRKGLDKRGAKHHKVLRDDIQGVTKPAIGRLARRGGVKHISNLMYEQTIVNQHGRQVLFCTYHDMVLAGLCNGSSAWLELAVEELVEGVEGLQRVSNVISI